METLTPRIQALRSRLDASQGILESASPSLQSGPQNLGDEPFHDAWMTHADAPFRVRLAYAQGAWRAAVQPALVPGHLVLGTPPPQTVISYQTGVFAWDFHLNEALATNDHTREIVEYWKAWLAERPKPELPAGMEHLGAVLGITGICCHSTQDYGLAIEGGLDGLRRQIAEARPRHPEAAEWYDASEIALDGVAGYIQAHADAAERAAAGAKGAQAAEWRLLAANCRHIASSPPATFLQAVQLFYFLFMLNGHDSPGRIDQYLYPPLQRELEAGTITLEAAQEIVDCLYIKLAEHICYGATIGGQLPEGGDATNALSWLCLHSIRRLRLLSPRTALRWHREMPEEFFAAAVHSIATGATFPAIVNDEVVVPGMMRRGALEEHARDYTFCGCGQVTPAGRAYGSYEDLILNAAKLLTYALHDGRDEQSGIQIGLRTGEPAAFATFAELEQAVWAQCEALLTTGITATNAMRRWAADQVPDFLRSVVTHSCVERGRDWRAGGADYHEGMVDVVGLTTLADSLTAIKRLVYDQQKLSLPELTAILDQNWAGAEELFAECLLRQPKFGNEDPEADDMLCRWLTRINDWLFTQRTEFGGPWGIDIIGWSGAVILGEATGATPDGRRAGEALADCAGPAQGRDRSGITAVLNSMVKIPTCQVHGPLALSLRIPANAVETPEGEANLAALLRGYLERGGQHLQITIASAEEMRAAQLTPEQHRDLIVRVGGFSAYFVQLEQRFQVDMIRRTEHAV
ncbi:MAG: pyruvate formate lyase family protein [Armatimonadota bacterium]